MDERLLSCFFGNCSSLFPSFSFLYTVIYRSDLLDNNRKRWTFLEGLEARRN